MKMLRFGRVFNNYTTIFLHEINTQPIIRGYVLGIYLSIFFGVFLILSIRYAKAQMAYFKLVRPKEQFHDPVAIMASMTPAERKRLRRKMRIKDERDDVEHARQYMWALWRLLVGWFIGNGIVGIILIVWY